VQKTFSHRTSRLLRCLSPRKFTGLYSRDVEEIFSKRGWAKLLDMAEIRAFIKENESRLKAKRRSADLGSARHDR